MKLIHKLICLLCVGLFADIANAQQTINYTHYTVNTLSINPAYAGSQNEGLSVLGLYRNQYIGIDNAPKTQTLSGHGKVSNKVGLGLNFVNESFFISRKNYINASASYTLDLKNSKLAFGISGGFELLDINTNRANGAYDVNDSFAVLNVENQFSPQVGAGFYWYSNKFYVGLSAPRLLSNQHFDEDSVSSERLTTTTSFVADERVTYFLNGGYVFDLKGNVKLKPAASVQAISGAPLGVDVSLSALFNERFSLGANYRVDAHLSGLIGFVVNDGLQLGFAYDRDTTDLGDLNKGTLEVYIKFNFGKRFF